MASKTFLQLYSDGLQQTDETTGSGSTTARTIIKGGINESYAEVAGLREWDTLKNETTVSTSSGTMEYTPITASSSVPRIRRIFTIIDETNNRELEEVKVEDFQRVYPYVDTSSSGNQGNPRMWFVSGYTNSRDIKVKVYPVPDSTLTLRVKFIEEPLELVLDSDVPRIPDQFHYGLAYLGEAKYYEFLKDPIASYYRGLHEQFKEKILTIEYDNTDEMPEMQVMTPERGLITGKIGRVYN